MWWIVASWADPASEVITDDRKDREEHAAALVASGLVPRTAVASIPSRSAIEALLKPLRTAGRGEAFRDPWSCRVTGARSAELVVVECVVDRCVGSCIHDVARATVVDGRIEASSRDATDDGACGCCMGFVE